MKQTLNNTISIILILMATVILGCKEEPSIVNVTVPSDEALALSYQGWMAFEQKNYSVALILFNKASEKNNLYADAYLGLAWTYARLDSMQEAKKNFDIVFGFSPAPLIDAYAGRSFVSLALGEYREAISAVQQVQSNNIIFYSFRHDSNISMRDLLLVKAQSHFFLGEYQLALQLINELDPDNTLNPSSHSYIADLAAEIEMLWERI